MSAATMRMMRVMSCKASHTRAQKLLGGLGGMTLVPKTSCRRLMSDGFPLRPAASFGILN